jgi:hypothetical protein
LVIACIQEELDFFPNMGKEDRIVVSDLTSQIPMPNGTEEKRNDLKN